MAGRVGKEETAKGKRHRSATVTPRSRFTDRGSQTFPRPASSGDLIARNGDEPTGSLQARMGAGDHSVRRRTVAPSQPSRSALSVLVWIEDDDHALGPNEYRACVVGHDDDQVDCAGFGPPPRAVNLACGVRDPLSGPRSQSPLGGQASTGTQTRRPRNRTIPGRRVAGGCHSAAAVTPGRSSRTGCRCCRRTSRRRSSASAEC
jgi:hypothetical protein